MNYLNPIVALILTALGLGIIWKDEKVSASENEEIFIPENAAAEI